MTVLYYILGAVGYLAFGFCMGVAREWAGQELFKATKGGSDTRKVFAVFFFPLSMSDPDFDAEKISRIFGTLLTETGGGFFYWNLLAFIWPLIVAWQLFGLLVLLVFGLVAFSGIILSSPSRFCRSCEESIKRTCGIGHN